MRELKVPEFGDIQLELMAKGMACIVSMPGPVAADIKDTMSRAAVIIGECVHALEEIKRLGIESGHLNATGMLADAALMLVQENTK